MFTTHKWTQCTWSWKIVPVCLAHLVLSAYTGRWVCLNKSKSVFGTSSNSKDIKVFPWFPFFGACKHGTKNGNETFFRGYKERFLFILCPCLTSYAFFSSVYVYCVFATATFFVLSFSQIWLVGNSFRPAPALFGHPPRLAQPLGIQLVLFPLYIRCLEYMLSFPGLSCWTDHFSEPSWSFRGWR